MPRPLKILVYGESWEWAMARNLMEALVSLGHQVCIFDHTGHLFRARGATLVNRALDRVLVDLVCRRINSAFLETLRTLTWDLVIVLKGIHLYPSSVAAARTHARIVVNWNPDDFFNPLNATRHLLASFPLYNWIFTPRRHLMAEYRARGANEVAHLPWYYLPDFLFPDPAVPAGEDRYVCDAVFLGTWSARREALLGSIPDRSLRVHGGCWNKASRSFRRRFHPGGPIFLDEMRVLMQRARINVNILTAENRDTTNIRNFEIPGCGAFQLSERSDDILEMFEEGKEIACFSVSEELLDKCRYYLENEQERRRIAEAGHARLIAGANTMLDRAKTLLATMGLA